GVARETDDVTGEDGDADLLPGEQHLAVFGNLVLLFAATQKALGIDAFETDKDARHSGASGLFDEPGNAVAHGVHLQDELDVEPLLFAHDDQAIEDRLPVLVAGEIVVGDEEPVDALGEVGAHDQLDVIGGTAAAFAALDVDDGAKGALKRAAAAGIEAGHTAAGATDAGGS